MNFKIPVVAPPPSKMVGEARFVPPSAAQQDSVPFDLGEITVNLEFGSGQPAAIPVDDARTKIGESVSSRSGDRLAQMQQDLERLQTTVQMIFQHLVLRDIDQAAEKFANASHRSPMGLLTKRTLADFAHSQRPHSTAHKGPPGREHSLPGQSFGRIAMRNRIIRWMFVTSTEGGWAVAGYVSAALFAALMFSFKEKPSPFLWLLSLPALGSWLMVIWKGPILRHRNGADVEKS